MNTHPDPTRYTEAIQSDLLWIQGECLDFFEQLPASVAALAQDYLARLAPEKAQLEWCLPLWLGQSLAAAPGKVRFIGAANVLGMIYVRIQNDVMDMDVPPERVAHLLTLASLLYTRCLHLFRMVFAAASPFWVYLEHYLQEWARAITWEREWHYHRLARYTEEEILWLTAGKGAPMKTSCAALAILARREEIIPDLAKALDLRSTIAQLLDDFSDWREDWQRGRYNIFLSLVLTESDVAQPRELTLSQLYHLIYRSPQAITLFDKTNRYAFLAQEAVAGLACEPITMLCHKAASMSQIYRQIYEEERSRALYQRMTRVANMLSPDHAGLPVPM